MLIENLHIEPPIKRSAILYVRIDAAIKNYIDKHSSELGVSSSVYVNNIFSQIIGHQPIWEKVEEPKKKKKRATKGKSNASKRRRTRKSNQ